MLNQVTPEKKLPSVFARRLARTVRIVTVPPLMVAVILSILLFTSPTLFRTPLDFLLSQCFLALLPLLAYPLSYALPRIRRKGRDGQRSLAMYLSAFGYLLAVVSGLLSDASEGLRVIQLTYLSSVVLLLLLNKVVGVRASGHACSVSGPILLLCLYTTLTGVVVGIALWAVILWASLTGGHHTKKEYLLGSAVPIVAYALSSLLYLLI